MHPLLIALAIFAMRILDVSIGTIRVIYTIRGTPHTMAMMNLSKRM